MRFVQILTSAALLCSISAMAAPAVGYASGIHFSPGGNEDSMLTKDALDLGPVGLNPLGVLRLRTVPWFSMENLSFPRV